MATMLLLGIRLVCVCGLYRAHVAETSATVFSLLHMATMAFGMGFLVVCNESSKIRSKSISCILRLIFFMPGYYAIDCVV